MSADHEQAQKDYMAGMKYRELAEKYQVSINTIKSWKQRYGWNKKGVHTKTEKGYAQKKNAPASNSEAKTPKIKEPELTAKQVLFVAEYLIDFNATRAAMAVGYSKKTARQIGYENLTKPYIQAEIKRQTAIVTESLGITSQRVLLEYLKIAFSDITDYVDFGQKEVQATGAFGPVYEGEGDDKKPVMKIINYVDFKESTSIDGTLISEVKQGRDGVSIKFHDKMKALEKLEKYLDLLPDQHKRMVEEEKLKLAREQLEVNKTKAKLGTGDETDSNENIMILADLLNSPVPDRNLEDFDDE
jgi:phage terminase small subunit